MANVIVQLPLDLSGTNPNNAIGSEEHLLVNSDGFPYKIITMEHGGFYARSLKVFDAKFNRLEANKDFIWTYHHPLLSERTGRDISSAIVFINKALTGKVYLQAQMVGGDLAYSFTVKEDYIAFWKTKPTTYVPTTDDYNGTEPVWAAGELANERWGLDTYQPLNNEMENIRRALTMGALNAEQDFRDKVKTRYDEFMAKFNDRLEQHVANKNNPHQITATQLGLGLVNNYPVATQAIANTGTSDAHYLTPLLVNTIIDGTPTSTLNTHINAKPADPHVTTAAQLNINTKAQTNSYLNNLYNKTDTVANANSIYSCEQSRVTVFNMKGQNFANLSNGAYGPGNCAYYETISNISVTVAAGDYLEYEIYMDTTLPGASTVCQSGIDARIDRGYDLNMRDWPTQENRKVLDQNGLASHPGITLNAYARNKWYYRKFNLYSLVGHRLDQWRFAFEGDVSGWYSSYIRRCFVRTASGAIKATIYDGRLQVAAMVGATWGDTKSYLNKSKNDILINDPDNGVVCTWMSSTDFRDKVLRKDMSTTDFPNGLVRPELIAAGVPATGKSRYVLRGDGSWSSVAAIKQEFGISSRAASTQVNYVQL